MTRDTSWLRDVPLAHRGLHDDGIAENSRSAFVAAVRAGYGVEIDVQLSADGVPVVFHDRSLARLAEREDLVARLSARQLAEVRLSETDDGVPTLAAALDVLRSSPTMVEVKSSRLRPGRLEAAIAGVLDDHPGPVCVASFNPVSLRWFRRARPELPRVLTAMATSVTGPRSIVARRLAELRDLSSVAPVAVSYALDGLPNPAVDAWRGRGGPVIAWTVTNPAELERANQLADNVIFERVRPEGRRRPR